MRIRIVDEVGPELADALHDIYVRALDVLIVRGVFDVAAGARAVARLSDPAAEFPWTLQKSPDPKVVQMRVMGRTLTPVTGLDLDLAAYFRHADAFRAHLADLLPEFLPTLDRALSALSGGRPVSVATSPSGTYTPSTIRDLPPGHEIPVHVGNFFLETPGYRELREVVAVTDQLSFFTPLQTPDAGGELVVYALEWRDPATPLLRNGMYDGRAIEQAAPAAVLAPEAGDLLLFDGGRYYHKVSAVVGTRHRWTIGGFVGFTKDMSGVVYWS